MTMIYNLQIGDNFKIHYLGVFSLFIDLEIGRLDIYTEVESFSYDREDGSIKFGIKSYPEWRPEHRTWFIDVFKYRYIVSWKTPRAIDIQKPC
jgi:hypothetical protein